jgi:hypothetical protein
LEIILGSRPFDVTKNQADELMASSNNNHQQVEPEINS